MRADDAALFHRLMGMRKQPPVMLVGDNNQSELVDVEGSIDLQWIQAIGDSVPTTYWLTGGGRYGDEPFLDWIQAVADDPSPPLVHSISCECPRPPRGRRGVAPSYKTARVYSKMFYGTTS